MDNNFQPNQNASTLEEQKFYDARVKENEDKLAKEFQRIFRLPHNQLTPEDIGFLNARQSYMTSAEREEYKSELSNFAPVDSTQDPLLLLTRKDLEAKLSALGVQDTSNKAYRTNADLVTAIKELDPKA